MTLTAPVDNADARVSNRPLVMFLLVTFGITWGTALLYVTLAGLLVPLIGELTMTHPLIIFALFSPSLAGLLVYYVYGGWTDVRRLALKMVPQQRHAVWFLAIFSMSVLYALFMRFGSILANQSVPDITLSVPAMIGRVLWNPIEQMALIGGLFGWIGFLLPFLHAKFAKRPILAPLLTGLLFGLWAMPGFLISSVNQVEISYVLYVVQLMAFIVFADIVFNATNGSLLLYAFAFWLAATGSHIQLYYFNRRTQLLEIAFFVIAAIVVATIVRMGKLESVVQRYPSFLSPDAEPT